MLMPLNLRSTARRMMVVVAIVALALFVFVAVDRSRVRALDARSGRYLVLVKTFRGASASAEARVLADDLRQRHGLPSYILAAGALRPRPAAPRGRTSRNLATNEVAVLIGDCETREDCAARRDEVRRVLSGPATSWRDRLRMYPTTQNPYLPLSAGPDPALSRSP